MTPPSDVPFLSPSTAKTLTEYTPYHAFMSHYMLGGGEKPDPSPAALFGTVVDKLVFKVGPDIVVRKPREQTTMGDHRTVYVTQTVYDHAQKCAESVVEFAYASGIKFQTQYCQPKWKWQSSGGVWCSARPDYFESGNVIDLKTCHSLKDGSVARTVQEYGYDIQAAAYLEAASAQGWDGKLRFLFVESRAPYACRWVELDSQALGDGTAKWMKAVATWKSCLGSDAWPGWDNLIVTRPRWAKKPELDWVD